MEMGHIGALFFNFCSSFMSYGVEKKELQIKSYKILKLRPPRLSPCKEKHEVSKKFSVCKNKTFIECFATLPAARLAICEFF